MSLLNSGEVEIDEDLYAYFSSLSEEEFTEISETILFSLLEDPEVSYALNIIMSNNGNINPESMSDPMFIQGVDKLMKNKSFVTLQMFIMNKERNN